MKQQTQPQDGITVPSHDNKCSYELFYGETPHNMGSLCTLQKKHVTKDPVNMSTKLDLCGRVCMFLRYSEDHTQNVYWFLNLNPKKVVYSQDVQRGTLCIVSIWVINARF